MSAVGEIPVVTIDGPSGSGKGTLARRIAAQLGFHLLDSGAIYRLTALAAARAGVALDAPAVVRVAETLDAQFLPDGSILLAGECVDGVLRTEQTGAMASQIAARPEVRAALFDRQKAFAQAPGLVADGRDMGTVVFPDAPAKIFLDASAEIRAERRYNQLIGNGFDAKLPALIAEIRERDQRDRTRAVAPLVPAADALVMDSSALSIETVEAQVMAFILTRGLNKAH